MDEEIKEQTSINYRIYKYIVDFITSNGYSPSMREIADGIGVSTQTVHSHLNMLEKLEKIHIQNDKARTISLVGYEFRKMEG